MRKKFTKIEVTVLSLAVLTTGIAALGSHLNGTPTEPDYTIDVSETQTVETKETTNVSIR